MCELKSCVACVEDFPVKGVVYRDITPLLGNAEALRELVSRMCDAARAMEAELIIAPESRGFAEGAAMAVMLGCGFAPVRRKGRLPGQTRAIEYMIEPGRTECLEISEHAIKKGMRVLIADEIISTGCTAEALCALVEDMGGVVAGICCAMEIGDREPRKRLRQYDVFSAIRF